MAKENVHYNFYSRYVCMCLSISVKQGWFSVLTDKGVVPAGGYKGYDPLLVEVVQFLKTKVVPVTKEETLEMFAFIEAADMSNEKGGKVVTIVEAMKKGQKEAKKLIEKLKI